MKGAGDVVSVHRYKEEMFGKTHTTFSPWIIVKANDKQAARLESLRYVPEFAAVLREGRGADSTHAGSQCHHAVPSEDGGAGFLTVATGQGNRPIHQGDEHGKGMHEARTLWGCTGPLALL